MPRRYQRDDEKRDATLAACRGASWRLLNDASGGKLESFRRPTGRIPRWFKEWQVEAQAARTLDEMFFGLGRYDDEVLEVIGHVDRKTTAGPVVWMRRARERLDLFHSHELLEGKLEDRRRPDQSDVLRIPGRFDLEGRRYRLRENVDRAGVEFPILLMFDTAWASHLRVTKDQFLEVAGNYYDRFVRWPQRDRIPEGWPDQVKRYLGDADAPHTSGKNLEADIEIVRMVRHCYWLMLQPRLRGKIDLPRHLTSR